jgi:hypothetical protein
MTETVNALVKISDHSYFIKWVALNFICVVNEKELGYTLCEIGTK